MRKSRRRDVKTISLTTKDGGCPDYAWLLDATSTRFQFDPGRRMVGRFGFATHVPVGVGQTSADTPQIASCPRLALRQPSKSLFPALVEGDLSVRKPRRLPRQLDDRLPLLAAISERHQKKAFIAFLHNLDPGWGLRHGHRTQFPKASSSYLMPGRGVTCPRRSMYRAEVAVVAVFGAASPRPRVRSKPARGRSLQPRHGRPGRRRQPSIAARPQGSRENGPTSGRRHVATCSSNSSRR
jgi:hypothetical protein